MRIVKLGLRDKFFDLLKKGEKIADGRLLSKHDIKKDDILIYYKDLDNGKRTDEKIKVKITDVNEYDNVESMIKDLKLKNILPGVRTIKKGEEFFEDIYGNKLKDGKLVGFTFEKLVGSDNKKKKNKLVLEKREPKTHEMYIKEPWMTLIREGLKEVEGRLYKGDVMDYRVGDKLNFVHKTRDGEMENLMVKITKLEKYPDFKALLYNEKLYRVLPGFPSIRTGNELYEKYYPYKVIKENGALAINFEIIGKNGKKNIEIVESVRNNRGNMDIEVRKNLNENQRMVNEKQREINKSLKKNKNVEKVETIINVNTDLIKENTKNIEKPKGDVNVAEVTSSQIAVNLNQRKVNDIQEGEVGKVVLKGKKK